MSIFLKTTEPPKVNRRSFLKRFGTSILGLSAFITFYSGFIERFWLEINRIELSFSRLPKAFSGLRIVQFSDIHLGFFYNTDDLKELVTRINRLKPDLICFTGDIVEDDVGQLDACIPILQKLAAPLGKVAVMGNHDYRIGSPEKVISALENSGFVLLKNGNFTIEMTGSSIYIAGVDDLFASPDLEATLAGIPADQFTILLAHEPDIPLSSVNQPIDLQLSGHSHGGQIVIPFVGPLYTPDGAKVYVQGLRKKTAAHKETVLYVNKGVGTTFLPVRFNCRPEITVFTLTS
jgi:hypothetical protein